MRVFTVVVKGIAEEIHADAITLDDIWVTFLDEDENVVCALSADDVSRVDSKDEVEDQALHR